MLEGGKDRSKKDADGEAAPVGLNSTEDKIDEAFDQDHEARPVHAEGGTEHHWESKMIHDLFMVSYFRCELY